MLFMKEKELKIILFLIYCLNHNIRQGKKDKVIFKITFELNEKKVLYITIEEEGRNNIRVINNNTIDCNENDKKNLKILYNKMTK